MLTTVLASFPSPARGVWHLGPVPIRAYALCIIAGIIAALIIGDRRWAARGGERGVIYDVALWAVPFGLIGGRVYHLMTDWPTYFGPNGAGLDAALRIWDGGLGIWGAIALGAVGAWIACRRRGIPLPAFGDAVAPGIVLAQAIGRLGNYFNQELYGRETGMPWGLEIFYRRDPSGIVDVHSLDGVSTGQVALVVQPTFLYELLWNLLVFVLLIVVDRRFKLGHGRLFALYVAAYCVGRFGVELLRDDPATLIDGVRINTFTSTFVFLVAVVYMTLAPKQREDPEVLRAAWAADEEAESGGESEEAADAVSADAGEDSAVVESSAELFEADVLDESESVQTADDEAADTPDDAVAEDESDIEAEAEAEAAEPEEPSSVAAVDVADEESDAEESEETEVEPLVEDESADDVEPGEPEVDSADQDVESEASAEVDEADLEDADAPPLEAADEVAVEDDSDSEGDSGEPVEVGEEAQIDEVDVTEADAETDSEVDAEDESEESAEVDEADLEEPEDAEDADEPPAEAADDVAVEDDSDSEGDSGESAEVDEEAQTDKVDATEADAEADSEAATEDESEESAEVDEADLEDPEDPEDPEDADDTEVNADEPPADSADEVAVEDDSDPEGESGESAEVDQPDGPEADADVVDAERADTETPEAAEPDAQPPADAPQARTRWWRRRSGKGH